MERGIESKNDMLLPFAFTCSSLRIKETIEKMRKSFKDWKIGVETLLRNKQRKREDDQILTKDQEIEEIEEVERLKNQFYKHCEDEISSVFKMVN